MARARQNGPACGPDGAGSAHLRSSVVELAGAEGDQAGVQVPAPANDLRRRGLGCGPRPWSPRGCGTSRRCHTVRPGRLPLADAGPRLVRVPPVVDGSGHLRVARQRRGAAGPGTADHASADARASPSASPSASSASPGPSAAADTSDRTAAPDPAAHAGADPTPDAPTGHDGAARRRRPPPRRPPWVRVVRPRTRAPPCRSLRRRLRRPRARRPRRSGRRSAAAVAAEVAAPLRR